MKIIIFLLLSTSLFISCGNQKEETKTSQETKNAEKHSEAVVLSKQQFADMEMKIDAPTERSMQTFISANGHLEVPPQSEATVTPVIGGNIQAIQVIEGDEVKKGSVLAYLTHPDIIEVQTSFLNTANRLNFLRKDFDRQKKLYEEGVGSGELFQRAEAELESAKAHLQGLKAQLLQLHIDPKRLSEGSIQSRIPVLSPISGAIQSVNIKTGQYVQPTAGMFEIINTEDVHVDLMVFEKDVPKVREGQKVTFTTSAKPGKEMTAKILSISKNFEREPKALHVHAEIENREKGLVPGMYVKARIAVENSKNLALPEDAITKNNEKLYVFSVEESAGSYHFQPVEITANTTEDGWTAITLPDSLDHKNRFAVNNAYYLMAELNKEANGEHGH